jgi:hypothetical protein
VGRKDVSEVDRDLRVVTSELDAVPRGSTAFELGFDRGLRNETVLDRLKAGLSSLPALSHEEGAFLTSGSLCSSFPFLSEAKYSAPRPNTTWRVGKSRLDPSVGNNHSCSASGKS